MDGFRASKFGEVPGDAGIADVRAVEGYGGDEGGQGEKEGMPYRWHGEWMPGVVMLSVLFEVLRLVRSVSLQCRGGM